MQSSIRTPGCIWAKLIEQNNEKARKPESKGDAYVFFVGPRNSGKSTLINRFLYPNRLEVPKPSEGLEYTYARKPSSYDHERKDLAHIWEVGGSQEFAEEISKGDQMFLTAKQLSTAVVVVVVDLSDPSSVLSTAQHWIDQVKKRLGSAYEKFSKRGFDLPDKLKERAKNKLFGKEHKDKDLVYHSGISLVLAATKYDALSEMDPEMKKVVARTLRFLAHANGAHLMYLSNLHASADGRNSVQDKACLDSFTKLMNQLIFTGLDKKPTLKAPPQMDHQLPLMILAGSDKFNDIGRPRGAVDDNIAAGLQEWCELYEKMFPSKDSATARTKSSKFLIDDQFKDEEIDSIKDRKMSELEAFRKDQEAAKEAARKHLLMAKAQAQALSKEAGSHGAAAKPGAVGLKASSGKPAAPVLATNGAMAAKSDNGTASSGQKTAVVQPKTQAAKAVASS